MADAERYANLSDAQLEAEHEATVHRHDWLIDNSHFGDERIYFANKKCDALYAEIKRRAAIAKAGGA